MVLHAVVNRSPAEIPVGTDLAVDRTLLRSAAHRM
jgi:hypothetical protein